MQIYLAPMEGLTGYTVRNAFFHQFGGFDKYYTPFIPAGKNLNRKTLRDLLPENNEGIRLVPQLLSNQAEDTTGAASLLAREYGFGEINLNLGCPSGTVSGKGRGSGFLAYPDALEQFLKEVYSCPDYSLSIKTRVGYHDTENWKRLMEMYYSHPQMKELIIHPRTQKDFYKGPVRLELYQEACEFFSSGPIALCYNGDITGPASYGQICRQFPQTAGVMIGRGAFMHPGLAALLRYREETGTEGFPLTEEEYRKKLRAFHDEIEYGYPETSRAPKDCLFRMKEIWSYLYRSFDGSDRLLKKLRKCQDFREYHLIVDTIFATLPLSLYTGNADQDTSLLF